MSAPWNSAVQGLWARVSGGAPPLRVDQLEGVRRFAVHAEGGVLAVAASDALSACVAVHRYLTEACGVRVTWGTELPLDLGELPDSPVLTGRARVEEFYYLNFCTFGYSTAYWDWDEWEREIDWMALHGVTMPLSLVGHEAVLTLAYTRLGLSDREIRAFLGGPGYLPWLYMGCLDSFAGPLPATWAARHLDLGRRILERQRELGMTPVLPAFTGHVPASLAPAGARTREWQGLPTTVVHPGEPLFRRLTTEIVTAQRELLGTDHLYAADPFIEMIPADTDDDAGYPAEVAAAIVGGLRAADPAATWVLQSWPFSYQAHYWSRERVDRFLAGLPGDAVLILDLWGEADPQWARLDGYAGRRWIWNGLLNFGGRSEPVADLRSAAGNLEQALAAGRPPAGLGLTMEAIHTNPAFFELIADRAWAGEPPVLGDWLREFGRQRYATTSATAARAWAKLGESVLAAHARAIFPERFISILVTRPRYDAEPDVRAALFYRPPDLLDACRALLDLDLPGPAEDDLVLSCAALLVRIIDFRYAALVAAASTGHLDPAAGARFLDAFDDLDDLVATRPALRLDTWVAGARRWADDAESRWVLEDNARRILTAWTTTDDPRLDDYAARIWGGLVAGYYKRRWESWLKFLPQALAPGGRAAAQAALDAELVRLTETFIAAGPPPTGPAGDARAAARRALDRYGDEFQAIERTIAT
ncbi:alpha-N-acetylglucosaminidase [Paractinoplanes globisporus]|uniref:Alpha-N-acetylglucosaminidase TIM-barrel domain-containing protein n=1 Tax=Paractinoplanes globisporus TaxID=113565 RepID=A0ABW6W9F2_9ACTN|nr:alpha-N-acetylglucosaminidase TIM-barrel domain-containing protein [Actinoplanes globisporus]